MQFRFRRRGTHTYVYLVQKARRDGRVVNLAEMYLGTQEELVQRLTNPDAFAEGMEFLPYPFGTAAAFLAADEELGFSRVVEELTGSRATALSLLAIIAERAHEPVSNNGMTQWAHRSLFRFLPDLPSPSCRRYLERMDLLTDEVVEQITLRLGEELVRKGHRPSLVFFDPTNFSTEQQPDEDDPDRQLPRPGHAKDENLQAKMVGLAMAVTDQHLPVYHRIYPGNENDARLFQEVVGTMVEQLRKFGAVAEELTFVFDRHVRGSPSLRARGYTASPPHEAHRGCLRAGGSVRPVRYFPHTDTSTRRCRLSLQRIPDNRIQRKAVMRQSMDQRFGRTPDPRKLRHLSSPSGRPASAPSAIPAPTSTVRAG